MINEEQKYKKLRELGQELGVPTFEAFLGIEILDRDGKVLQKDMQRSHSWVRNAYNLLFSNLAAKDADQSGFGDGILSTKDTGGVVYHGNFPIRVSTFHSVDGTTNGVRARAADSLRGILVGSGTTPESFEDFSLATQITEGVGPGQLSHVLSNEHIVTWDAGTRTLRNEMARFFNNNSGGDVNVNEVVLCTLSPTGADHSTGRTWILARDVLPTTVTVPDTGQLKVTYVVQLTYP